MDDEVEKKPILLCGKEELKKAFELWKEPSFRLNQVWDWAFKKGASSFEEMSNLPKSLREKCAGSFSFPEFQAWAQKSKDGTQKFQFKLKDGSKIESVWIPEKKRNTLCISSQVGCAFQCAFCVTGTLGLKRNLSAEEIILQVWHIRNVLDMPVSNIVFMGMGEPLQNMDAVCSAIDGLSDPEKFGIGKRKITVSTVGLVNRIPEFVKRSGVELAISLTGVTNPERDYWMPINKVFDLKKLKQGLMDLDLDNGQRITFEVVLIKGSTDTLDQARHLSQFLRGLPAKVNIIPYNENDSLPELKSPSIETVLDFQNVLKGHNIPTFIRRNRGNDIDGACGMLAGADEKNV